MFEFMNAIVKQDIVDILKVNIPSWLTITWVQIQVEGLNTVIQETGTSLLILATLAYTIFKAVHMFRNMKWAKEDRQDEVLDD